MRAKLPITAPSTIKPILPSLRVSEAEAVGPIVFLLGVILMTEEAFHVPLWMIHAFQALLHIVRAVALDAMPDYFGRHPHWRSPSASKVFIQAIHSHVNNFAGHLGTTFFLRLRGHSYSGSQGPR